MNPDRHQPYRYWPQWTRHTKDLLITLCLWGYFTGAFLSFFFLFYLAAFLFCRNRSSAFQRLNHSYFKGFFFLCRLAIPQLQWQIDDRVRQIHSSIIISNHISYLDPILLISLYSKFSTIAKDRIFTLPIFGPLVALSGFLPSSGSGPYAEKLLDGWSSLPSHLSSSGNFIVFPEGTRSRSGNVGTLHKGIFKIARSCKAPIKVIAIRNTDKLFTPGKFLFNTCRPTTIRVDLVSDILPEYDRPDFSLKDLMTEVRSLLDRHLCQNAP